MTDTTRMDKGTLIDAATWRAILAEAERMGGIRSLTFANGTTIVYDPPLVTGLQDWEKVTGHPVWHAIHALDQEGIGIEISRLPGTGDTPLSGEKLGERKGTQGSAPDRRFSNPTAGRYGKKGTRGGA